MPASALRGRSMDRQGLRTPWSGPIRLSRRNARTGDMPILPKDRDPCLITIRRGGTLTDGHHRLLAEWALHCAEHVLPLFEDHQPDDSRPRDPMAIGRAWIQAGCAWASPTRKHSGPTPQRPGSPIPQSSQTCPRARPLRLPTSPPITWAPRRTPSGLLVPASRPKTLRRPGPGNGGGNGRNSPTESVNWFWTANNAAAPSYGTSSTAEPRSPAAPPSSLRFGTRNSHRV